MRYVQKSVRFTPTKPTYIMNGLVIRWGLGSPLVDHTIGLTACEKTIS